MLKRIQAFLFKEISPTAVSIFRIVFGSFMVYQVLFYYSIDFTFQFMTGPEVLFPYPGLEKMVPLSLKALKVLHLGLLFSAILMTIGFLFRFAVTYFTIVFTYFSFIDNTLYNNHIYLISLVSFVLIFTNADARFAFRGNNKPTIPAWNQYLLIFLISLPYFFGGIAKISPAWLNSNLADHLISISATDGIKTLLPPGVLTALVTYGGLAYDLIIVFLLLNKRTLKLGFILILIFNLSNHFFLFNDIGLFPFLMISATIIFVPSETIETWLVRKFPKWNGLSLTEKNLKTTSPQIKNLNVKTIVILVFVLFHITFPFRHLLYQGDPEWTAKGSKFAWRMKMQTRKITKINMTIWINETKEIHEIDPISFISVNQAKYLTTEPLNLITLAKYVQDEAIKKYNINPPMVKMDLTIDFNHTYEQEMFSSDLDLASIDPSNTDIKTWLTPLKK